jgi:hypothetical protein
MMEIVLKFWEVKSVFDFRKLNKIARGGLKSRNLHGGMTSNLEHSSCWQLLLNLHKF